MDFKIRQPNIDLRYLEEGNGIGTSSNIANQLVKRDTNGNFDTTTINASSLVFNTDSSSSNWWRIIVNNNIDTGYTNGVLLTQRYNGTSWVTKNVLQ